MIKAEQVPNESLAAAVEALTTGALTDQAIAAALNAWPGMTTAPRHEHPLGDTPAQIILPLHQEPHK